MQSCATAQLPEMLASISASPGHVITEPGTGAGKVAAITDQRSGVVSWTLVFCLHWQPGRWLAVVGVAAGDSSRRGAMTAHRPPHGSVAAAAQQPAGHRASRRRRLAAADRRLMTILPAIPRSLL